MRQPSFAQVAHYVAESLVPLGLGIRAAGGFAAFHEPAQWWPFIGAGLALLVVWNKALNDAGDAGASVEFAAVRATRDEIQAKLGDAVGALETIRLNLLRLHAGSGSIEGLTTHLGLAAEVSESVVRLIAAKAEVQKLLAFPRTTQPTPV